MELPDRRRGCRCRSGDLTEEGSEGGSEEAGAAHAGKGSALRKVAVIIADDAPHLPLRLQIPLQAEGDLIVEANNCGAAAPRPLPAAADVRPHRTRGSVPAPGKVPLPQLPPKAPGSAGFHRNRPISKWLRAACARLLTDAKQGAPPPPSRPEKMREEPARRCPEAPLGRLPPSVPQAIPGGSSPAHR